MTTRSIAVIAFQFLPRFNAAMTRIFLLTLCFVAAASAESTQVAEFHGNSLLFYESTTRVFGNTYRLNLTTGRRADAPNGELAVGSSSAPYSHASVFLLHDPILFETYYLPMSVDVPMEDANTNGLPDVLEFEGAVAGVTTPGLWLDPEGGENPFSAVWTKEANSMSGWCQIYFPDFELTFNPTFDIFHFEGLYTFNKQGTNLVGQISLARKGDATSTLAGPLQIGIESKDRLNLQDTVWTNAQSQAVTLDGLEVVREEDQYVGYFWAEDGDLTTALQDYNFWTIRFPELADKNVNGVPDMIEDPAPVDALRLGLRKEGDEFKATIFGAKGQTVEVQRSEQLGPSAQWVKVQTLQITEDPATVPLATEGAATLFFRLRR